MLTCGIQLTKHVEFSTYVLCEFSSYSNIALVEPPFNRSTCEQVRLQMNSRNVKEQKSCQLVIQLVTRDLPTGRRYALTSSEWRNYNGLVTDNLRLICKVTTGHTLFIIVRVSANLIYYSYYARSKRGVIPHKLFNGKRRAYRDQINFGALNRRGCSTAKNLNKNKIINCTPRLKWFILKVGRTSHYWNILNSIDSDFQAVDYYHVSNREFHVRKRNLRKEVEMHFPDLALLSVISKHTKTNLIFQLLLASSLGHQNYIILFNKLYIYKYSVKMKYNKFSVKMKYHLYLLSIIMCDNC